MVHIHHALAVGLATMSSVLACTESTAYGFDDYIIDHLPNFSGSTSSSSSSSGSTSSSSGSSSSDLAINWANWADQAVNNVAFGGRRRRRQDAESFSCSSADVCLYQPTFDALLCYNQNLATYKYENGLRVDIASGKYTTPEGQKGDFDEGPCPGNDFEMRDDGDGCKLVRITKPGLSSNSDTGSGSSDKDSASGTDSDDSNDSAGSGSTSDKESTGAALGSSSGSSSSEESDSGTNSSDSNDSVGSGSTSDVESTGAALRSCCYTLTAVVGLIITAVM